MKAPPGAATGLLRSPPQAPGAASREVDGSPAALLEQSPTLAEEVNVELSDGIYGIPACYYEFDRRYPMPDGALFQGFVPASADKLFESTNVRRP